MGTVINREGWLTQAIAPICAILAKSGRHVDPKGIVVSVGWKHAGAMNENKLHCAEAWAGDGDLKKGGGLGEARSEDGKHNIFVDPRIGEGYEALGAMTHAICHIAVGFEEIEGGKGKAKRVYSHGPLFKALCTDIGLTKGKPVDAMPEGPLSKAIGEIADSLGEYPHGAITPAPKKKQKSRRDGYECPACEMTLQLTKAFTAEDGPGIPFCACKGERSKLVQFVPSSQRAKEKAEADAKAKSAVLLDPSKNGKHELAGAGV